jgi:hypothetical protein
MKKFLVIPVLLLLLAPFVYSQEGVKYNLEEALSKAFDKSASHIQGLPVPVSPDLADKDIGTGTSGSIWNTLGVNFYQEFGLTAENNNLNVQDEVCVGDRIKSGDVRLKAEWFSKGGPHDSPPVLFVPNLQDVIDRIDAGTYKTETYGTFVCAFVETSRTSNCIVKAQVICEPNCSLASDGGEKAGNEIVIDKPGSIEVNATCRPSCIVFVDRPAGKYKIVSPGGSLAVSGSDLAGYTELDAAYGYMTFCTVPDFPVLRNISGLGISRCILPEKYRNLPALSKIAGGILAPKVPTNVEFKPDDSITLLYKRFSLTAKPATKGPVIQLKPHLPGNPSSKIITRVEVQNTGDAAAYIDKIEVTSAEFKILYSPEKIEPNDKTEILLEVMPTNSGSIDFNIEYSSETLGCLGKKDFFTSVSLISGLNVKNTCTSESDCPAGETCCVGICRPSSKGVCDDIDGDGEPDTWVGV